MLSTTLSCSERIIKSTVTLQREKPFFAYILMNFETRETKPDSALPTMGVSKYGKLYWNADFVKTLNNNELSYVLCHETLHIAKGDFFRQGKRDALIWNVASDAVINLILNEEGMTPPKMGIIPDKYGKVTIGKKSYNVKGLTTEELYDELVKDAKAVEQAMKGQGTGKGGGKGDGQGEDAPFVGHGGFDVHLNGDKDDKGESTGDEAEGSASIKSAENKWKKVAVEAATTARQRGKLPGFAEALLDKLLNPVVDWRSRLRSFITNEIPMDYCNRMPGRKFYATGAWSPRVLKENLNLFVSIDCSGSTMGDRERFVGEIQGIVTSHPQLKARLIFWSYGEINENNDIPIDSNTIDRLAGLNLKEINGGTEMSAYARYLDKMGYTSRLHITLTDGAIESKPEVAPGTHLFVLCGHGASDKIVKEFGECIKITDEVKEEYEN
jgi:predicted metal-dependent peptidase